jgi:hypothetical protein
VKEVDVMMASAETRLRTSPPSDRRAMTRHLAAALCGIVGVLYLILLLLVADAESGASENTYGAYLLLAVPYLIGAGLLLAVDRRALWIAGAAVQVAVIVLFVMFGAGVFGPGQGVFDYDALSGLHMEVWAAVITGAEAVLLGLLSYLAFTRHSVRHDVTT